MMNKWDKRMLDMALLVATWSKDPSSQVGAVIADSYNRVVSVGFNGFPRGVPDSVENLADREEKLRRIIHAEANAILFSQRSLQGCALYVTRPPCGQCAAKLIQVGIARVVAIKHDDGFVSRWERDMVAARAMYCTAGVSFSEVTL